VIEEGELTARALYIDRFGNVQLNVSNEQIGAAGFAAGDRILIETEGGRHQATYALTFADLPEGTMLIYEDSYGAIAIAVNRGDAAAELGIEVDAAIRLKVPGPSSQPGPTFG
jgi:hypothetical protein